MPISKRYLDTNPQPIRFDVEALAAALDQALPEAVFVYLLGSAASGTVNAHSDIDFAAYLAAEGNAPAPPREVDRVSFYDRAAEVVERLVGAVRCDLGILNTAEPVYRFEALKGKLLFIRDREQWLRFYSITCREYEHQMVHYEKQRRYRLEARA